MKKVKVSKEEKNALDMFLSGNKGVANRLQYYMENHEYWDTSYRKLRNFGVEKLTKCIIYGYELDIPEFKPYNANNIKIELITDKMFGNIAKIDIGTGGIKHLNILDIRCLAEYFSNMVRHHDEYYGEDNE